MSVPFRVQPVLAADVRRNGQGHAHLEFQTPDGTVLVNVDLALLRTIDAGIHQIIRPLTLVAGGAK